MSEYGLLQMISCPTRVTANSASLIDLFFTSDPDLVRDVGCEEFGLSDHGMIFGALDIKVVRQRGLMRMIRCFRRCDQEALIGDLKSAPWQVMESMTDIGDRWEYWKQLFWEIVDSHIPLKRARVRSKSLPWITHGIRALMRARSYFSTKAKKSRKDEDWEKYKSVRNLVTQRIRKAKIQYFEELSEESKGNPKKAWREVNRLLGSTCKHGINSIRTDSHLLTEREDIADEFGRYFSSIVGDSDSEVNSADVCARLRGCEKEFKFDRVKEDEVLALLRSLDPNKAVSSDEVSAKILRVAAAGISGSLTSLFNYSLESGELPGEWKSAHITPVPKGGDSEIVVNYRPVSVLPVVAKVFERLIHKQLYTFLHLNNILEPNQFGFRPGHSTQDVLVNMVDGWRKAMDEDKVVGAVYLNFSKAFDMVDHSLLLLKMAKYGVRGKELKWFTDYLYERRQRVCVENAKSDWATIRRGVPQGSILGPLLFIIYANDLPQAVQHCFVQQYADDTTLSLVSKDVRGLEDGLTSDLEGVAKWVIDNKLRLNEEKTQMLLLSRRRRLQELEQVDVRMGGTKVARSKKVKYLGVWIDDGLTWQDQVEAVRRKCFAGLAKLKRLRNVLPSSTKKRIFCALVQPHLDYCSVVWQECSLALQLRLDRIQNYGMRLILSQPPRTPSEGLRKRLNWMPLSTRREMFRMVLVHRCLRKQAPRCLSDRFKTNAEIGNFKTRGSNNLFLTLVKTEFFRRSFTFKGAWEWNKLPIELKELGSVDNFKRCLKKYLLDKL